ncbi:MAG: NUDIX hydrolase [Candidatus Microgenomates bacterium]
MKTTIEEVSAGGVIYRRVGDSYEFLIGKHSGYHKWVLPKGLVERGESYAETAVREVQEEVGVVARVVGTAPVKSIEYWYFADLESKMGKSANGYDSERRVKKYQEEGGVKTRIHKKVIFYLMEYVSDLGKVGWEMEERAWVGYEKAISRLAFDTEKEVLVAAYKTLGDGAPAET